MADSEPSMDPLDGLGERTNKEADKLVDDQKEKLEQQKEENSA